MFLLYNRYLFLSFLYAFTIKKTAGGWRFNKFGFYIKNWIYSGDDLLFRGLSQSTIGDTGFPCLVRDGTEGGSRSIITRINPANIIIQY